MVTRQHACLHFAGVVNGSWTPSTSGRDQMKVAMPIADEPDKEKAMQLKRQGDEAFVRQDYAASAEAYSASLKHDTSSAAVWANRAAAYLRLGRVHEALEDARRSRAVDPGFAKAWYREGSAYAAMNLWEDAACAYFEGCQLAPGNKEFEAAFKGAISAGRRDFLARNPPR
ncbi:hypothetical protein DUNSADRAFT_1935 [Dunaliella salina]|uniref:Serine/threonine-protein kinase BSK1-like TPR repeats domain-containing protein n=1 Tax=Dunaliella salina TaxID=3046 RepID=A0ABQ7FWU5_DUNSA|nr:hypothetical protein DUNSADRAFT_1935 [Dunaliella salina]|eukprot:KAF5826829.1 hypothetical protein DUNSADRAFT_1935 [Dunaliella salina]